MKAINYKILIIILLYFWACKKDKKVNIDEKILIEGKYYLHINDSQGGSSWFNYTIYENSIFSGQQGEFPCTERIAGVLRRVENEISIPFLHSRESSSMNPCIFSNDKYGGDTLIFHFLDVKKFTDNFSKQGLTGSYFCIVQSGLPFKKKEGTFTLGYKPNQQ